MRRVLLALLVLAVLGASVGYTAAYKDDRYPFHTHLIPAPRPRPTVRPVAEEALPTPCPGNDVPIPTPTAPGDIPAPILAKEC